MNQSRITEIERRLAATEAAAKSIAMKANQLSDMTNLVQLGVPSPAPQPVQGGCFRWETRYRVRCIFNTRPVFSSSGSQNPAKDLQSFNSALDFLSQWHEFEAWEYPVPPASPYRLAYFYHMFTAPLYHNAGDTIDDPDWRKWNSFSASSYKVPDVTHLTYHGGRARFGYFPENYKIVIGPDEIEYTGSNKYMPDVTWPFMNATEYWITANDDNWYDRYPDLYLGEWQSDGQGVLHKFVNHKYYNIYGQYVGFHRLMFARHVIDDMTEQPFEPFVFDYGPEAGTTGSYTFPARIVQSSPISSEGDVEIQIQWGPPEEPKAWWQEAFDYPATNTPDSVASTGVGDVLKPEPDSRFIIRGGP